MSERKPTRLIGLVISFLFVASLFALMWWLNGNGVWAINFQ
jgi:hypothetical protein